MFCPACGAEYVAGILTCVDCDAPLVPDPPVEDEEMIFDDPVVLALEVYNPAEAEIVCSLLQAHGIPCILKAENQYAVDATYTVGPLARRRILVRESELTRAREILQATPSHDSQPDSRGGGEPPALRQEIERSPAES